MAKKKKGVLNMVLGVASDATGIGGIVTNAEDAYKLGKNIASDTKGAIEIEAKKNKIKSLLIEIGDKVYSKNIKIDNKDIMAEVSCIKELEEEMK